MTHNQESLLPFTKKKENDKEKKQTKTDSELLYSLK